MPYSSKSPVNEAKPLCVYSIDASEWNWKPSILYSEIHLLKDYLIINANTAFPKRNISYSQKINLQLIKQKRKEKKERKMFSTFTSSNLTGENAVHLDHHI